MNINNILSKFKTEADKRLKIFFNKKIKKVLKTDPTAAEAAGKVRDFTMAGGQRIRPLFAYYGYLAAGGKNKKAILNASLCAEFVQSYMLIHDDIIDRDELRRGQPTLHVRYARQYQSSHLGLAGGILAGNLAATYSYEILESAGFKDSLKIKALRRLNLMNETVLNGQIMDIFLGINKQLTINQINKIFLTKTASYTVEGPLQIGAILADASNLTLSVLQEYGQALGVAFQIKDDILGMFGEIKVTGKSDCSDIKEGKKTLLILEAIKRSDAKNRFFLESVLGKRDATDNEINGVRKIVRESGALDAVYFQANNLAVKAKQIIQKAKLKPQSKEFLIEIADYIVHREK